MNKSLSNHRCKFLCSGEKFLLDIDLGSASPPLNHERGKCKTDLRSMSRGNFPLHDFLHPGKCTGTTAFCLRSLNEHSRGELEESSHGRNTNSSVSHHSHRKLFKKMYLVQRLLIYLHCQFFPPLLQVGRKPFIHLVYYIQHTDQIQ